MEQHRIDIVSDAICPWCWIGKRNLEAALGELGWDAQVHFHPFQLNPDMPQQGRTRAEYRAEKFGSIERSRELDAQVTAAAAAAGLDFRLERQARTPNTVAAHRLVRRAGALGVQPALVEALFRAYFHDGEDIGDLAMLARIGEAAGIADAAAFIAGDEEAEAVLAEDAGFRSMGISGVPSFALDRHLLFSGAMAPQQMAAAFRRGAALLAEQGGVRTA